MVIPVKKMKAIFDHLLNSDFVGNAFRSFRFPDTLRHTAKRNETTNLATN